MSIKKDFTLQIDVKNNRVHAPLVTGDNKWIELTPFEEFRQKYVQLLLDYYGFSTEQMAQEVSVPHSDPKSGMVRADIVVWRSAREKKANGNPIIVIECKANYGGSQTATYSQALAYATMFEAKFFVTTNLKETKFFGQNTNNPEEYHEIMNIPDAYEISNDQKIAELTGKTKENTQEEFSQNLLKCYSIIRHNNNYSQETAFEELTKILYLKMYYEKESGIALSVRYLEELRRDSFLGYSSGNLEFHQYLFERAKAFEISDSIFGNNESLRIHEKLFIQIIDELSEYNIAQSSNEVFGGAFEKFLARTFRGSLGQFFTPRTVVNYMLSILDPEAGEKICDPCSGSGGFLVGAFDYIQNRIKSYKRYIEDAIKHEILPSDYEQLPDDVKLELMSQVAHLLEQLDDDLDINSEGNLLENLSHNSIFGADINQLMVRMSKVNMMMHGVSYDGIHLHNGLLNINGIYEGRFDIVLTNPPFGVRVDKSLLISEDDLPNDNLIAKYSRRYGPDYEKCAVKNLRKHLHEPLLSLYKTSDYSAFTEVLFLERSLQLLRPGGRLGIVLPEVVLNHSALQRVRDFVEGRARLINITSIPQDLFMSTGATVKPSIVFLKKFTESESANYAYILKKQEELVAKEYSHRRQELEAIYKESPVYLSKSDLKEQAKMYKEQISKLEAQQLADVRRGVREQFNYSVPIVEVEKRSTNRTADEVEEELKAVAVEFAKYRLSAELWTPHNMPLRYHLNMAKNTLHRIPSDVKTPIQGTIIEVPFSIS